MSAARRKPTTKARDGAMAFFAPRDAAELAAALAWLDAQSPPDAMEGSGEGWSVLTLAEPRIHPRAPALFAAAARVTPTAIAAVLDGRAFIDDDGELRLWPWYPEEDDEARPLAQQQAEALGLALPRERLDEPFEPAHYLARLGQQAMEVWLRVRGIDVASARIDRVPIPPRKSFPEQRFEGGMRARSRVTQAVNALANTSQLYKYVPEDHEHRAELDARLDQDLARLCARVAGDDDSPIVGPTERDTFGSPQYPESTAPVGRVVEAFALRSGALLGTEGALIRIDAGGKTVSAWRRPYGSVFAREDLVFADSGAVLDLSANAYVSGDAEPLLARVGLVAVPSTSGHDERSTPLISACGRYLLDVDESPYIVRLVDKVTVAEGQALERALTPPTKNSAGLVATSAVAIGQSTILDGVRFVMRTGESPVRDGRSLAFALAGDRWRFLAGSVVREGGRAIARLGVPILCGAFSPDGSELWALGPDHAIHVVFDPEARAVTIAALEPVLREASRLLATEPGHA